MRIEQFRKEVHGDRTRVVATVIWENRDRPAQDVFFETTAEFAEDLSCNPNAFLTACVLPAMRFGEQRIAITEPICPELRQGLDTVMHTLVNWFGGDRQVIPIEAPLQSVPALSPPAERAGCFFSGGIDALSMLRNNQLHFSKDHPRYFQDGILIYGILKGEDEQDPAFRHVMNAISALANTAGITPIPVYTNAHAHIRDLDPYYKFWKYEYQGSFLASVGHALTGRLSSISIASTYDLANLDPWGSHPLLDHHFSSSTLQIRHEEEALSRFDKTKVVAEWQSPLKHLRVCNLKNSYQQGNYNCGQCEKCVRTMTALLALGKLDETKTFLEKDVSKQQLVKAAFITDSYEAACYQELIEPLKQIGRDDLVRGIESAVRTFQMKVTAKQIDKVFLNGSVLNFANRVRGFA
jgi:hypothetical protein